MLQCLVVSKSSLVLQINVLHCIADMFYCDAFSCGCGFALFLLCCEVVFFLIQRFDFVTSYHSSLFYYHRLFFCIDNEIYFPILPSFLV